MEEKETSMSIFHRELNLVFVYIVIFLAGIATVGIMTTILNNKVKELNQENYSMSGYNNNI